LLIAVVHTIHTIQPWVGTCSAIPPMTNDVRPSFPVILLYLSASNWVISLFARASDETVVNSNFGVHIAPVATMPMIAIAIISSARVNADLGECIFIAKAYISPTLYDYLYSFQEKQIGAGFTYSRTARQKKLQCRRVSLLCNSIIFYYPAYARPVTIFVPNRGGERYWCNFCRGRARFSH